MTHVLTLSGPRSALSTLKADVTQSRAENQRIHHGDKGKAACTLHSAPEPPRDLQLRERGSEPSLEHKLFLVIKIITP